MRSKSMLTEKVRGLSVRVLCLVVGMSLLLTILTFLPMKVSAAPDTHTWDGGGADAYAGTHANWVSDIAPTAGDAIVFDAGALPCIWNLSYTFGTFSIAGYSGVITQGANFGVGAYNQASGTFTGSTSYVLTVSGSFAQSGGTVTNNILRLIMTGDGSTVACSGTFYDFQASANVTVSTNALGCRHSLTVDAGKTLTAPAGTGLNWQSIGGGAMTNNGVIAGTSTFYIYTYNVGATITFGSITIPTVYLWLQSGGTSNTITMGADATMSTIHLRIKSAQSGQILTFSTGNYNLTINQLTVEAGGSLNAGSSTVILVNQNWDSSLGAFTPGTSTVIMQGASKTVKLSASQSFYNFRSSASPCITVSNISVSHDLIVDAGKVIAIGSTFFLDYNCSGGGSFSNAGMITSPGTIILTFDIADKAMTLGTLNANVWIMSSSDATATRTLDLEAATIFGRALYLYSESSHLMVLDARGVSVQVTMGFVNGTNGMVYYTDWSDSTPYVYDIYRNATHYYARNAQNGTIEQSSLIADYADTVVQYAVNATRVGGEVHFTDAEFIFATEHDFYVGGWNYSIDVSYAYQLTVSGSPSTILRFRENLNVDVGKGVAIFRIYGTSENVTFTDLVFEWSPGLVASYSSGMFFSSAITGMIVDGCSFNGLNWSIWQDGLEFGVGGDAGNYYTNNAFTGGWRGMALHNIQSRTVISGNTFTNIGSALMIDSVEDVLIEENTFIYSGEQYCIDIWDRSDNITVAQNYFRGTGTGIGVIIDQVAGKGDASNVIIVDNAFTNLTTGIAIEPSNDTIVALNLFLNVGTPISDSGIGTDVYGNLNFSVNATAIGSFDFDHAGLTFADGYSIDIDSSLTATKDISIASIDGVVTEIQTELIVGEYMSLSFVMGSFTLELDAETDTWLNLTASWGENGGIAWAANQGASYTLSSLDANMGYRVYQDGDVIATGTGPSFSFTATGGGEFEVVVWYDREVSSMIVLTVNMVGLGIMVSIIGTLVIPLSRDINAKRQIKPERLMKDVVRTVIFIVVGLIMWGLLHQIAIG